MPSEYSFTFALNSGLHARPASALADFVRRFDARVTISGGGTPAPADARSVLSVIGLDIKFADACTIRADGTDADRLVAALPGFIAEHLSAGDAPPPHTAEQGTVPAGLPHSLRAHHPPHVAGVPACVGIGIGAAVTVAGFDLPAACKHATSAGAAVELAAARTAIDTVRADLATRAAAARSAVEHDLLLAHRAIADDPALWSHIERAVADGRTALQALGAAVQAFTERLRGCESASIRDRALDVQDVATQLAVSLGVGPTALHVALTDDSVVFADALTPSQFLRLDPRRLKGLVLGAVGATSHTVILARSQNVPTVVGVASPTSFCRDNEHVVVDAVAGIVMRADPIVNRYYESQGRVHARRRARLLPLAQRPACSLDGHTLEVGANATAAYDISAAMAHGADGIGLFRTEWLFLDRDTPPTEDEQYAAYSAAVAAAKGKPIIIRTFDIGGDKPAAFMRLPREDNPFLGKRGFRLYETHATLLRTQLRAILRASAHGPVKIMAPMISLPAEAAAFRERVRDTQAELAREGTPFDANVAMGIMIEVPAAALVIDQLAEHADFFSIGTNDLCQYWFAADRGNPGVAELCSPYHPSFLRLLRLVVSEARALGRWIGLCGDMGGHAQALPLMLGLGVNEISISPGDVAQRKAAVRSADTTRCRELLNAAATCRDAAGVHALLNSWPWRGAASHPILSHALVEVGTDAQTKEEAIRAAVDLLFIDGRTDAPNAIESAVWVREATYSTGLGYGFAIPHCKTEHVSAPSLAVLRLSTPVGWDASDGEHVHTVILLAIPASDAAGTHMKVFAKLARKLMHEEFRTRLRRAADARAIVACLSEELDLA